MVYLPILIITLSVNIDFANRMKTVKLELKCKKLLVREGAKISE